MLYNEQVFTDTVDKTRYERAHRVEVAYPLGSVPAITFVTSWVERDNETGAEVQMEYKRALSELYSPSETFPLFSGGEATHEDVMQMLYSLFFAVATKVDNAV